MTPARVPLRRTIDLAALALLLAMGLIGFAHDFTGPGYLIAGGAAIVLALLLGVLAAALRLGPLGSAAVLVVAYFATGTAAALSGGSVAAMLPSLASLQQLAVGAVGSWKALATAEPPIDAPTSLLLVPFITLLVCGFAAATLTLRTRHAGAAAVVAGVPLVVAILFGTDQPVVPIAQAILFGTIALLAVAWRRTAPTGTASFHLQGAAAAARAVPLRRAGLAVAMVLVSAAVAAAAAPLAPLGHRTNLRDAIQPPIDLHDLPSPLASFHRYVVDEKQAALFTVQGLPSGSRIRLATMDAYDGTVFTVSDGGGGSGTFRRAPVAAGTAATAAVTVGALGGVWLPDAAGTTGALATGAALRKAPLGFNAATAALIDQGGLQPGDRYLLAVAPHRQPGDAALGSAASTIALPKPSEVPPEIAEKLTDFVGQASTPIAQLRAIAHHFSATGYYSDGAAGQAPSLSGHGAARLSALLSGDRMIGDDEQYASAMALMADQLGYSARVVLGFYPARPAPPGATITVRGQDAHAWVEVNLAGSWIPFDPTPPKSRTTTTRAPQPKPDPVPQVQQPPPPVTAPDTATADTSSHSSSRHGTTAGGAWRFVAVAVSGGIALLLLLLLAPLAVVAAVRARRRARRRSAARAADRISGGWDEVVDWAAAYGTATDRVRTRRERAIQLDGAFAGANATAVAVAADDGVFGPGEPTPQQIDDFWSEVDALIGRMGTAVPRRARLRARYGLARTPRPAAALRPVRRLGSALTTRRKHRD